MLTLKRYFPHIEYKDTGKHYIKYTHDQEVQCPST